MAMQALNELTDRVYGKNLQKLAYYIHAITGQHPETLEAKVIARRIEEYSTQDIFELDTFLHQEYPTVWPEPFDNRIREGRKTGDSILHTIAPGIQD